MKQLTNNGTANIIKNIIKYSIPCSKGRTQCLQNDYYHHQWNENYHQWNEILNPEVTTGVAYQSPADSQKDFDGEINFIYYIASTWQKD